jgi:hypothetical protein
LTSYLGRDFPPLVRKALILLAAGLAVVRVLHLVGPD